MSREGGKDSRAGEQFEWRIAPGKHPQSEAREPAPFRLGVLISGSGSNLQALIDAIEGQQLPGVEIALVVSNNASAYGIQRALKHRLPVIYLPWTKRDAGGNALRGYEADQSAVGALNRPLQGGAGADEIPVDESAVGAYPLRGRGNNRPIPVEMMLSALLRLFRVDLIILAGWMRILSASFLAQFPQRVINLHPALLPDDGTGHTYITKDGTEIPVFRGLHAVRQALEAGVKVTGSTVHYVTPEVDAGPVICREEVAIVPGDTEESLHERIKAVEHRLIVEAVRKLCARN